MSKKFQITMKDELVNVIDEFAAKNNISRSAAITRLCTQNARLLQSQEEHFKNDVYSKISNLERQVEDLQYKIASMISNSSKSKLKF